MAANAEEIAQIEDISARLDALMDSVETASSKIAEVGRELDAGDPLPSGQAPPAAPERPAKETHRAEPPPAAAEVAAPETSGDAPPVDEPPAADAARETTGEPGADGTDLEVALEAELDALLSSGEFEEPDAIEPDADAETPDAEVDAEADVDVPPGSPSPVEELDIDPPSDEELGDLLLGPEGRESAAGESIDGDAPAESGSPEADDAAAASRPPAADDEAELIGALDEQLAALADEQLAAAEIPDLADAPPAAESPEPAAESHAEPAEDVAPGGVAAAAPEPAARADAQPAPAVVSAPSRPAKPRDRLVAAHAWLKPRAKAAAARGRVLAIELSTRVSEPLRERPVLRQTIGWVALVQAFFGACVWAYLLLWHDPAPPPPKASQPDLIPVQDEPGP